jgi:phycocyanobilin:ferredoxin oxidoreductase
MDAWQDRHSAWLGVPLSSPHGSGLPDGPVAPKVHPSDLVTGALSPDSAAGVHPLVDALAERIRCCRDGLPGLASLPIDPELEAISGSLDGERLFIRNELHYCHGLRKLHLETARLGAGLQILHCVFFPDPHFDLPIFGADIVASRGVVSAAIVDLSPVDGTLKASLSQQLAAQPRGPFSQVRDLPPWGSIFSPQVLFVRPQGPQEEGAFVESVAGVLAVLEATLRQAKPQASDDPATIRRWQGQFNYCRQQKLNDKTRRVLEKAFNPAWADHYIEQLLFDDPPELASRLSSTP